MTLRTYRSLPPIVSGYPLDDVWSVIIPIARTNLLTNPSLEANITNWTAFGSGSIARSTTFQYHGAYSLAITPTAATTDGAFQALAMTSGVTYAVSCKFKGTVPGLRYRIAVYTSGGVLIASREFIATGRWQWQWMYYTETATLTRNIVINKVNSTSTALFYIDGIQAEIINAGETVSTYIDGDQFGLVPNQSPPAYVWNGTPHASTSSRIGQTRAGGMVVPFRKYGFLLTAVIGLGMASVQNVATDYARIDGSYDDYTRKPPRQFTLTGRFSGRTYAELRRNRSGLAQIFDRDLIGQDQRLTLLRTVEDGYGRVTSSTIRAYAKYESGFGGSTDNMHAETVPITFTQNLPAILADGESGATLDVQDSVTNANRILLRSPAGVWSAIGTGAVGGNVYAIAQGLDGIYYIGGDFTSFGGVANTRAIVQYNPVTGVIAAMGTGGTTVGDTVNDIQIAPNGDVWVIGNITNMGGVAAADFVGRWNGSAWNGVGVPSAIPTLAAPLQSCFDLNGNFYYPTYTNTTIKKWDAVGLAWSTVGTVTLGSGPRSIIRAPSGNLTAGGTMTIINAVNVTSAAHYNVSTGAWTAVGGTAASSFGAIAYGANGFLYAALVAMSDSVLGMNNGTQWVKLGNLNLGGAAANAAGLAPQTNGPGMYITGDFTTTNGVTLPDSVALWTGGAFVPLDVDLPGTATVYVLRTFRDGSLALGFSTSGTATSAGTATVTNPGTARSYPTVVLNGPSSGTGRVYQIANTTTGRYVYLNLTLNAGETAKLVFQPDNLSFTSDFQGNIAKTIMSGSNEADFFLSPGANTITSLSASSTITAVIYYRPGYASIDDVP